MKREKSFFKNRQGFGITDALVASALLGIVATIFITMTQISRQSNDKLNSLVSVEVLRSNIVEILTNPETLLNTIKANALREEDPSHFPGYSAKMKCLWSTINGAGGKKPPLAKGDANLCSGTNSGNLYRGASNQPELNLLPASMTGGSYNQVRQFALMRSSFDRVSGSAPAIGVGTGTIFYDAAAQIVGTGDTRLFGFNMSGAACDTYPRTCSSTGECAPDPSGCTIRYELDWGLECRKDGTDLDCSCPMLLVNGWPEIHSVLNKSGMERVGPEHDIKLRISLDPWCRKGGSTAAAAPGGPTPTPTPTPEPVSISFSASAQNVTEAAGASSTVRVSLSQAAPTDVSVSISVDPSSTAKANGTGDKLDYNPASIPGSLTIPAGQLEASFSVTINADNTYEGPEKLILNISNPTTPAVLGTPSTTTITITDADTIPKFRFDEGNVSSVNEGANNIAFKIRAEGTPGNLPKSAFDTVIALQLDPSSTANYGPTGCIGGADFTINKVLSGGPLQANIVIPAYQTEAAFQLSACDDAISDPGEFALFRLAAPANVGSGQIAGGVGTVSTQTVTLLESSGIKVGFDLTGSDGYGPLTTQSVNESSGTSILTPNFNGVSARAHVTLDAAAPTDVVVSYVMTGTATFAPRGKIDTPDESIRAFEQDYIYPMNTVDHPSQCPQMSCELPGRGDNTNPPPNGGPPVWTGTLLIPAGQTEGWIYFDVLDDKVYEGDETIILSITDATTGAKRDISRDTATIVINEDESLPTVSLSDATSTICEGSLYDIGFVVSVAAAYDIQVNYSASGNATFNQDYTFKTSESGVSLGKIGTITIPATVVSTRRSTNPNYLPSLNRREGSDCLRLTAITDAPPPDDNENVTVKLTSAKLLSPTQKILQIADGPDTHLATIRDSSTATCKTPPSGCPKPTDSWVCVYNDGSLREPDVNLPSDPLTYDLDSVGGCCAGTGCFSHNCAETSDWGQPSITGCPFQARTEDMGFGSSWCVAHWACVPKEMSDKNNAKIRAKYKTWNDVNYMIAPAPGEASTPIYNGDHCTAAGHFSSDDRCDGEKVFPYAMPKSVATAPVLDPPYPRSSLSPPYAVKPTASTCSQCDPSGNTCLVPSLPNYFFENPLDPKASKPYCSCPCGKAWDPRPSVKSCVVCAPPRLNYNGQCLCPKGSSYTITDPDTKESKTVWLPKFFDGKDCI